MAPADVRSLPQFLGLGGPGARPLRGTAWRAVAGRFRSARTQRHTRTPHGCELPPRPRTFTWTHRDTRARGACCPEHPMLPSPGPLSAPGFSPPLPRAALDTRARQTAQAAAAGTLHTKPANERSTVCGGSGLVPASEHGGCLPPKARGRESQARPSGNEGLPFLGPWSLREDGRRERSRIHRTPLAVSRSEAAPLWATSPLLSRGQPSNYGHTPWPLGARIRAVAVLAVKSTLSQDMTLRPKAPIGPMALSQRGWRAPRCLCGLRPMLSLWQGTRPSRGTCALFLLRPGGLLLGEATWSAAAQDTIGPAGLCERNRLA